MFDLFTVNTNVEPKDYSLHKCHCCIQTSMYGQMCISAKNPCLANFDYV